MVSFCSSEASPLKTACCVPRASSRESSQFGLWQCCGKRGKEGGAACVREGGPGAGVEGHRPAGIPNGTQLHEQPWEDTSFFFFFKARRSFYLKPFFPPSCNFSLLFTSSLLLKDVLLKLMQEKGVPPWLWAQSSSRVPRMQQNLDPQSPWLNLKPLRPVRPGPSTSSGNPGSSWHTVIL